MYKLLVLTSVCFIINSCGSDDTNKENDSATQETTVNSTENENLTMSDILSKLEKADLPIDINIDYLESNSKYKHIGVSRGNYTDLGLLDNIAPDTIEFIWKHQTADWTMVCMQTSEMNAKGITYEYYLITLGEMNYMKDNILWAGSYAISTENPNGGTSAGQEFRLGTIDMMGSKITTTYHDKTEEFSIDLDGNIDKIEKEEVNIKLNYPTYTDATLINIINNTDYITAQFDIDGKEVSFNYQSPGLFEVGNDYFDFDNSTGTIVPPIKVKDGAKKKYRIRYEYQYFENLIQEMDTNMVLTGIANIDNDMKPDTKVVHGSVLGYDDNGDYFLFTVKDSKSNDNVTYIVIDTELQTAIQQELGLEDKIELLWDWAEVDNAGEGIMEPRKILFDYNKVD